jgi:hypothetical protein
MALNRRRAREQDRQDPPPVHNVGKIVPAAFIEAGLLAGPAPALKKLI